ncbi:putative monovalent cation/H+ antiporter subunit A [Rhizobium sp. S-51]|uniref:Putative monovalent cation/H+ antiporter subunit A n=1 Tax=Rhizobium terricola TaxID=2728849 RepID=A0A7Y0B0E5_9HYPH|nr:putative monovalent cation/H+ antiporter subunit A [Rhizobium terricola]NML76854.1 putative monovalent cation/H+ antiporter subunit A [Rhizobium terricola]
MLNDVAGLTLTAMLLPFAGALLAPVVTARLGAGAAWLLALAPLAAFVHFLRFVPEIANGEVVTGGYAWVPSLSLSFSWYLDGLSLTFALLITGIGTLIVLYAGGYLKGHPHHGRFFSFILMFMGAMLGVVVSDSFLMLFVFWELTSITSFLLIGFDHEREASRRAALQALVVTGGGGLLLLAGLFFIWNITGVTQLSLLLHSGELLRQSPFYAAALFLVLGGAFTKSAQFPFHFWLPNAMEAPTPVSAYLHSATMVKAGVYLLMRLNPVMGATPAWEILLPFFGGITLLVGASLAIRQTDLKLMLAYTTVASLGLLVLLTGFGSPYAVEAAVLYLVAHSLFKGALFMVAGIIDHEAGTRDVTRLGGLRAAMPLTFLSALFAAVSMAGLPPFFGFLAKEEIYAALAGPDPRAIVFTGVAIAGNALMFAIAFAVALKPFLGPKVATAKQAHEGPVLLWLGPLVLSILGLCAAIFSGPFHAAVSSPMASAVAGKPEAVTISLVPHLGLPLALSALTVIVGVAIYLGLARARALMVRLLDILGPGPDRGFDHFVAGLVRLSFAVTRFVQNGRLEVYVTFTFFLLALVLLVPPFVYGELPAMPAWPAELRFHEASFFVIALVGVAAVLAARDRLTAIVSLGIQGFAVAVLFLLFGAPDLSFTQFMVETLSVVILALVMTRIRLSPSDHRALPELLIDAPIAIAAGLGFALMLLKSTQVPFDTALTDFFNTYSKVIAHGANVVNVIIVDFRGTDTLGEIAVVMITGLAILALIRIRVVPVAPAQKTVAALKGEGKGKTKGPGQGHGKSQGKELSK